MTLRTRILLTVAPLLLLTAALGAADAVLLYHMGRSIDYILRDNLRSVDYMVDLNTALDGIDDCAPSRPARPGRRPPEIRRGVGETQRAAGPRRPQHHHPAAKRRTGAKSWRNAVDAYRQAADRFLDAPSAAAYFGDANRARSAGALAARCARRPEKSAFSTRTK